MVIGFFMFSGCGNDKPSSTTKNSGVVQTERKYFLYSTSRSNEYLSFLDKFDEEKYEIVNISVGHYGDTYYMVTYKVK